MAADAADAKPRVLILGGVGFVGRHLTAFIVKNALASKVRVVDKVPPAAGWLNAEHKAIFEQVEFRQANLGNRGNCERVFADEEGRFDFVFNLACETKYGQINEVYKERVLDVTVNCAQEAAKSGVKRFVEVSTAQIYDCDKGISHEGSKLSPWTSVARFKLQAEAALSAVEGLDYVIVRPAIIYGIGDLQGLMPRLVTAACYRVLQEKMKLLWTRDMKMNTVHVRDVCRALWHLRSAGASGDIFNLADKGKTTQGIIADMTEKLFDIEVGYFGSILSNLARLHMASATEESNEKHLGPWSEACQADGISNTPLTPYLDQELLYNKHLHVSGAKIETTGFSYEVPCVTIALLREVVDDYMASGLFPPSLLPAHK